MVFGGLSTYTVANVCEYKMCILCTNSSTFCTHEKSPKLLELLLHHNSSLFWCFV